MLHYLLSILIISAAASSLPDPTIYDDKAATTTVLGCECEDPTSCATSATINCDTAPFCTVKNKHCARGDADYSYTHLAYYDYCVWPEYTPYEKSTAAQKHALLIARVNQNKVHGSYPSTAGLLGVFTESVSVSFEAQSDVFTQGGRIKYIHSVGTVAPIKWVSSKNHPYTGLFQGSDYGLIRFSSATAPSASAGFTPGAAIKFLRDGVASANFPAMPGLDPQACSVPNFFTNNFSNHLPEPKVKDFAKSLLKKKFWQASYCPQMVGLSDFADPVSNATAPPVFPFRLDLVPAPGLKVDIPCDNYLTTGLANFAALPEGTTLFDVLAVSAPGEAPVSIGALVTTGNFTTSKFGDEQLFFKHQYMEEDWHLHPDWLAAIDKTAQCGMSCSGTTVPGVDKGCTSPFPSDESVASMVLGTDLGLE